MAEEKKRNIMTVGIVRRNGLVLLGLKLRGLGEGLLNGPGGKAKEEEDAKTCFIRETEEESGLIVNEAKQIALIEFEFANEPEELVELHIFEAVNWAGEPQNSDEMIWQWFDIGNIPYDKMWEGDRYWLKPALEGKVVGGKILYDSKKTKRVVSKDLYETG